MEIKETKKRQSHYHISNCMNMSNHSHKGSGDDMVGAYMTSDALFKTMTAAPGRT